MYNNQYSIMATNITIILSGTDKVKISQTVHNYNEFMSISQTEGTQKLAIYVLKVLIAIIILFKLQTICNFQCSNCCVINDDHNSDNQQKWLYFSNRPILIDSKVCTLFFFYYDIKMK